MGTKRQKSVAMLGEFVFSLTLPQTRHEIPRLRARSTATCNARRPLSFRSRTWIEGIRIFTKQCHTLFWVRRLSLAPLFFRISLAGARLRAKSSFGAFFFLCSKKKKDTEFFHSNDFSSRIDFTKAFRSMDSR